MNPPFSAALGEPERACAAPALVAPPDVLPALLDVSSYRPSRLGRALEYLTVRLNRGLDSLPGSRWLHRRILANLELTDVQMPLGRGAAGLDGLKVAFISDVHAGSYLGRLDICRLFEQIATQEPDVVCLGGDLINSRECELEQLCEPLSRLRPPLGVFAVPGNHDHDYSSHIDIWRGFL